MLLFSYFSFQVVKNAFFLKSSLISTKFCEIRYFSKPDVIFFRSVSSHFLHRNGYFSTPFSLSYVKEAIFFKNISSYPILT